MRVLVANKFWYRRGGQERVMFDEIAWLQDAGHDVAHFSTAHPDNEVSPWSGYFSGYLELGPVYALSAAERARAAGRMFWNGEAARQFGRLLSDYRPDVVHVHGIHRQISPSILTRARLRGIPVVQSLHDYHHICPADVLLFRGSEPCLPRRCGTLCYGAAVRGRCMRGSLAASALSAAETTWQRVRRSYEMGVSRFISPSAFLAEQMRLGGWTKACDVIPNAVAVGPSDRGAGADFCVVARLSGEKGVRVALEAARLAGVRMVVAGEGPVGPELRTAYPEAMFLGRLGDHAVSDLLAGSRAAVVPSLCVENAPMSVLEAMAAGKPVVASAIGGIPEQIRDGVDGLLVRPGDVEALAGAMRRLAADDGLCERLGDAARVTVAARFSPDQHLAALLDTYRAAGAVGD
jgi:glycosyltransferase involved in cell wall biosynthesis